MDFLAAAEHKKEDKKISRKDAKVKTEMKR